MNLQGSVLQPLGPGGQVPVLTPRSTSADPGLLPRRFGTTPSQAGLRPSNTLHRPGEPPSPDVSGVVPLIRCSHVIPVRFSHPLRNHDSHARADSKATGVSAH